MDIALLNLAVAPGIAIVLFIYLKDKFEREPFYMVLLCFFLGVFTIIPPIFLEQAGEKLLIAGEQNLFNTIVYAFIVVGLSEEFSKFLLLRVFPYRSHHFNEPFDGIVYAVVIAMGFATIENIFYVYQYGAETGIMRMFTAVPAHAAFGVLMGFFAGLAKFRKRHFGWLLCGLIAPTIAHGFYDYFLIQEDIPGLCTLAFVFLAFIIYLSLRAISIHRRNSPFNPANRNDRHTNAG